MTITGITRSLFGKLIKESMVTIEVPQGKAKISVLPELTEKIVQKAVERDNRLGIQTDFSDHYRRHIETMID